MGKPIESATDYATIKAYAPYENIRRLTIRIFGDRRADRPARHLLGTGKWIARLRARTDDGLTYCVPK